MTVDLAVHDVTVPREPREAREEDRGAAQGATLEQTLAGFARVPVRARLTADTEARRPLVAVVGLGDAGLESALALRRAGLAVVAIEPSPSRLEDVRCGRAGVLDAHRAELRARREDPAFALDESIAAAGAADLVLICVPATLDRQRRPSPHALRRACASVVRHARAGQTLVLCASSYVGATRELLVEPLGTRGLRVGEDVCVAFCAQPAESTSPPSETVGDVDGGQQAPGQRAVGQQAVGQQAVGQQAVGQQAPGQQALGQLVVGGVTETCFRRAAALLRPACEEVRRVSSPEAGEMVRLYESAFEAVNVALAFELADACRTVGVPPIEVADAAGGSPPRFMARLACAGVPAQRVGADPHLLLHPLRERGAPAKLAEEALRSVDGRARRLAMRAHELLLRSASQARGARVLVVGTSCEPGADDRREAPAIEIIARLRATGAQVDFHDPLVPALVLDGEETSSVDPDPRRDGSGFGPEDYDLTILLAIRPGYDYGWLRRSPQVLDCTYRHRTGRRYYLP